MKKNLLLLSAAFLLLFNTLKAQEFTISGGSRHSINVCANGDVYSWGSNIYNQLGRPGGNSPVPGKVILPDGIKIQAADAGTGDHTLAIDCNGNLWSWGQNADGQLGNGVGGRIISEMYANAIGGGTSAIPVKVLKGAQTVADGADGSAYLADVKNVSAGGSVSFAIVGKDRALMAWGSNIGAYYNLPTEYFIAGLLGNNESTKAYSNTPVYVKTADGKILKNIKQVEASSNGGIAISSDGKVFSWGLNTNSFLGNGKEFDKMKFSLSATSVKTGILTQDQVSGVTGDLTGIVEISSGDQHTIAISANGTVYSWGGSWANQTGTGYQGYFNYAVNIGSGQSKTITGNDANLVNVSRVSASMIGSAALVTVPDGNSTKGYLYTFGGQGTYKMVGDASALDLSGQLGQGHNTNGQPDQVRVIFPDLVDTFKLKTGAILRAKDVNVISVSDGAGVFYVITQDKNTLQRTVFVMGANNLGQLGLGDNKARNYPTELTLGCDLAEPCPVVNLGPDKVVCGQFQELLRNNAVSYASYSYKWTYIDELGAVTDVTLNPSSAYLTVSKVGKYVLSVSRGIAGGCTVCETASDTIELKTEVPAFKAPSDITYCQNVAPSCYVITANPTSRYAWYETYTSQDILEKSTGSEEAVVYFTGIGMKPDQKKYTLWVADSTIFKGVVAVKDQLCTSTLPEYNNIDAYSTQFVVYNQLTLKDFKVRLYNQSEMPDFQNPNTFKKLTNQINVDMLSAKQQNGSFVPDQVIKTFTASITVQRRGMYELTTPAAYSFAGDAVGKTFFFRIKSAPGEARIDGGLYSCQQDYSKLADNISGHTAAVTATLDYGRNKSQNYGYIYGFNIEKGVDTKCPRFPVEITESCTITAAEEARTTSVISIYPNPSESTITVNASNFEKATLIDGSGREINSFFTKEINLENYLSGMYYLKVQTKDKTEILKVVKQ